jgi:hypothetical protein
MDGESQQARAVRLRAHYLIDIANAVIVDVEATPARTYDEVAATRTMITRTEQRLGLKAKRLVADTAYGTGKFLGWLIEAGITPHIPVWDKSSRDDGTFSRADFTFDSDRNLYVCPAGKLLTTTGSVGADHVVRYRARRRDCRVCPLKPQCCPNASSRKVTRDQNEEARDHARALMGTTEFATSRDERKKVEMRFAHLKTHHRFERLRLRGLSGARDEFHLAAIVQNLKTLACQLWQPPLGNWQQTSCERQFKQASERMRSGAPNREHKRSKAADRDPCAAHRRLYQQHRSLAAAAPVQGRGSFAADSVAKLECVCRWGSAWRFCRGPFFAPPMRELQERHIGATS